MSEQKMREALTYIEGLASADDARDLPTIAATAQEALAAPAGEGLTDEEIIAMAKRSFLCEFSPLPKPRHQIVRLIRESIAAHEAKKAGGA